MDGWKEVFRLIEIGTTIVLELKDDNSEKEDSSSKASLRYKCRLVDVMKNIFVIDFPINEVTKKPEFFLDGTQFIATFIGKDQAIYSFHTELQGKKKGQIPTMLLKDPGKENYLRIQRRNYVRIETSVDIAIHPIDNGFKPFTTISIDLSGGGIAISIPLGKKIPNEGIIICWLALQMQSGDIYYIRTESKIVRVVQKKMEKREKASLQFITIDEQDRQRVIRYCFERQLALKRNKN